MRVTLNQAVYRKKKPFDTQEHQRQMADNECEIKTLWYMIMTEKQFA